MNVEVTNKLDQVLETLLKQRGNESNHALLLKIAKKAILDTSDMLIIFQVCPKTMERWRKKFLFNHTKVSGKYYYLWDDIAPLLQSRLLN